MYNLGTIMYALSELVGRRQVGRGVEVGAGVVSKTPSETPSETGTGLDLKSGGEARAGGMSTRELQTVAAMYICCAQATNSRPVYASSLRLVRHTLPLPALAVGALLVAPPKLAVAPASCWSQRWFNLDHEAFWTTGETLNPKP